MPILLPNSMSTSSDLKRKAAPNDDPDSASPKRFLVTKVPGSITVDKEEQIALHLRVLCNVPSNSEFFEKTARDALRLCAPERMFEHALVDEMLERMAGFGADKAVRAAAMPVLRRALKDHLTDMFTGLLGKRVTNITALKELCFKILDAIRMGPDQDVAGIREGMFDLFEKVGSQKAGTEHIAANACEGMNTRGTIRRPEIYNREHHERDGSSGASCEETLQGEVIEAPEAIMRSPEELREQATQETQSVMQDQERASPHLGEERNSSDGYEKSANAAKELVMIQPITDSEANMRDQELVIQPVSRNNIVRNGLNVGGVEKRDEIIIKQEYDDLVEITPFEPARKTDRPTSPRVDQTPRSASAVSPTNPPGGRAITCWYWYSPHTRCRYGAEICANAHEMRDYLSGPHGGPPIPLKSSKSAKQSGLTSTQSSVSNIVERERSPARTRSYQESSRHDDICHSEDSYHKRQLELLPARLKVESPGSYENQGLQIRRPALSPPMKATSETPIIDKFWGQGVPMTSKDQHKVYGSIITNIHVLAKKQTLFVHFADAHGPWQDYSLHNGGGLQAKVDEVFGGDVSEMSKDAFNRTIKSRLERVLRPLIQANKHIFKDLIALVSDGAPPTKHNTSLASRTASSSGKENVWPQSSEASSRKPAVTCVYWYQGHCTKREEECIYMHEITDFISTRAPVRGIVPFERGR